MKKTYQKPVVLIEDFAVTETIASSTYSCGVKLGLTDMNACDLANIEMETAYNRYGLFGENVGCGMYPENDEICYHGAILNS